jgi:hypothetical protein
LNVKPGAGVVAGNGAGAGGAAVVKRILLYLGLSAEPLPDVQAQAPPMTLELCPDA